MAHTIYKPIDWYCPEGERKDGDDECEKTQLNGVEEVFGEHTDTVGNFHWIGTRTGDHEVR